MSNERTRSEYHRRIAPGEFVSGGAQLITLDEADRRGLAQLMLDGYRGSVDDEGETFDEALQAVDHYLGATLREHSFVLKHHGVPIAMSLSLVFRGTHCIDPVVVTAAKKGAGLGRQMVEASLASLADAGVTLVRATITDGNEPSERLFASLGFERVGPWPQPGSDL